MEKAIQKESKVLLDLDNPVLPPDSNRAIKYVRLLGDGAGNISDTAPKTLYLADKLGSDDAISKFISKKGFKLSDGYSSLTDTDHMNAEARYIWADKIVNLKSGATVGDYDLPVIQKAMNDGTPITLRDSKLALTTPEDFNDLPSVWPKVM